MSGSGMYFATRVHVRSGSLRGARTALYCHCKRCQRRAGPAFSVSALTVPGSFEVTRGEDTVRSWQPPDDGWIKAFCAHCGSQVFTTHPENPELISIRMGALDGDPGIRPSAHQFVDSPPRGTPCRMTACLVSRSDCRLASSRLRPRVTRPEIRRWPNHLPRARRARQHARTHESPTSS
jgi:hypothetical protein